MKDKNLLKNSNQDQINEEYWIYLMHIAESADREIRLMDEILKATDIAE